MRGTTAFPRVRLVIADVDGTLLTPDKILTARARRAVSAIVDAGIAFTVTSGRPPMGMRTLIDELQLQHPVAAFNGGLFVRPDLSVIHEHVIPSDKVPLVVDILRKHTLTAWSYTETEWRVPSRQGAHVDREEWTVGFAPVVSPTDPSELDRLIKIVGVTDDPAAMARGVDEMQRTCGQFVSAALSQPYYLDVTHPEANKGEVVDVLSDLLHIPAAQIATIGDMPNDILMFQRSGMSIAMANASVEVRRAASAVTASNTEEGFAAAMERFVLPMGSSK